MLQSGTYPFEQNVPLVQRAVINPEEEDDVDVVLLPEEVEPEQTKGISGLQSKDTPLNLQHSNG